MTACSNVLKEDFLFFFLAWEQTNIVPKGTTMFADKNRSRSNKNVRQQKMFQIKHNVFQKEQKVFQTFL